ncbi:MAG: aldo/keto reductase [Gemmatimonadetes bacterium]|nr:aldo/keto reductase [Gemmatimonadota bacterium]|tara:strand:+ start:4151 stop:5077 length:927 start_codon:yes stop_codon:yes gene_type:complete
MLHRTFGKTGFDISAVGMGTWNIGNQWGNTDDGNAFTTIRTAFDHGVTLFDTAENYGIPGGTSEERLGLALAGIRHQVTVVSKTGNWGRRIGRLIPRDYPDTIRVCVHASLHRLRTDWLDVILCHEGNIEDPGVYIEGFEILLEEGRVRAYGISTNELDVLKRFNANGRCSVVQVDYSLLNRAPEEEFLPYCKENNIGVMIRGPLAKGLLSGRYDKSTVFEDKIRNAWHDDGAAQEKFESEIDRVDKLKELASPGPEMVQMALRYVISHPAVSVVIPGAKDPSQAITNAAAGSEILDAGTLEKLRNLT